MENNQPNAGTLNQPQPTAGETRTRPQPARLAVAKKRGLLRKLKDRVFPGGSLNKRFLIVLAVPVLLFALWWKPEVATKPRTLKSSSSKVNAGGGKNNAVVSPNGATSPSTRAGLTSERGAGTGGDVATEEAGAEVRSEHPPLNERRRGARYRTARYDVDSEDESNSSDAEHTHTGASAPNAPPGTRLYANVLRAGQDEARPTIARERPENTRDESQAAPEQKHASAGAQTPETPPLPRGLRLPMELVDPFASGLSAVVRARVTQDVKLPDGRVITRGSEAYLPMSELSAPGLNSKQGRVVADPEPKEGAEGFIYLGAETVAITGAIYGADGFAGLPGKRVKVSESESLLRRIASPIARAGAQAIGRVSPVRVPYGIEREVLGGNPYSYRRPGKNDFIVVVEEGAKFEFVVGL